MSTFTRHARLWRRFMIQAIVRETNYRAHAFMTLAVGALQTAISLIPIALIFHYVPAVRGWTIGDTLVVNGVFLLTNALLSMFVLRNAYRMNDYVGHGELDLVLLRPVDAQFVTAFRWINPAEGFNVVFGLVVLGIGLARSDASPNAGDAIRALLLFGAGFTVLTCVLLATVYVAFWTTRIGALPSTIADTLSMGRYPVSYYPGPLRIVLLTVLPVGFATTVPARALLGRTGWGSVVTGLAFAAIAVLITRLWWTFAIRRYSSASS